MGADETKTAADAVEAIQKRHDAATRKAAILLDAVEGAEDARSLHAAGKAAVSAFATAHADRGALFSLLTAARRELDDAPAPAAGLTADVAGPVPGARCSASMGSTWCHCCKAKHAVENGIGRVMGVGPFCALCAPWWQTTPEKQFGDGCQHDGSSYVGKRARTGPQMPRAELVRRGEAAPIPTREAAKAEGLCGKIAPAGYPGAGERCTRDAGHDGAHEVLRGDQLVARSTEPEPGLSDEQRKVIAEFRAENPTRVFYRHIVGILECAERLDRLVWGTR